MLIVGVKTSPLHHLTTSQYPHITTSQYLHIPTSKHHMKRILFIINPISGVEGKQNLPKLIATYLNQDLFSYEITYTQYRHHAKEITRAAIQRSFDVVVAVGGDGSVNEIASELVDTEVALGIISLGSGNGLARKLGVFSPRIPESIDVLNAFCVRKIDVGVANGRYFFSNAGMGVEADVVADYAHVKRRGLLSYAQLGYSHTFEHQAKEYQITLPDGSSFVRTCFMVNVSNAGQYGYGIGLTPESDLSDGLLELTIVRDFKPRLAAAWLAIVTALNHPKWSGLLEVITVDKCTISVSEPIATQIDGDPAPPASILECYVKPQALKVLVKQDNNKPAKSI